MTSLARTIRNHRESARSRRELMRAINNATTPGARDDLIMAMQRQSNR
ncbi:hypothetical protein [Flexivirga oryzae]|uniref:Uncharacterized protein n=1 Tax=Flexivirga oryzae TaxID=1794944 RepID=A0A839N4T2_9MICO|nr:hypothetical protein [Flexivirga oryzae]MBB2891013.1 hypothetical protein [Flexivirga oryzae]